MKFEKYVSPILDKIRSNNFESDLDLAHDFAVKYINNVDTMKVFPGKDALNNLAHFNENLPEGPESNENIINFLDKYGSPGTTAQSGGRYFGFVVGGILPSALCSKWLSDAWDQNAGLYVMSPTSSKIEEVCENWLKELLGLPKETVAGFVNGSSTATMCGLLAGRNFLLKKAGWDVAKNGLFNAPEIKVVLGDEAHSTVFKALSIIGLGNERIIRVPSDSQGRIIIDKIPELDSKTLLILQAGNVNSGSFDEVEEICIKANKAGAWVHIDGAFGLWAAACDEMKDLLKGYHLADSWSADAHKTLNAPYDNGIVFCKHMEALVNAMNMTGAYIIHNENRDGMFFTPDMSRRARAIDLWASLKGLGKKGVSELVYELHCKAAYFAELLNDGGIEVLNDVVFNQVLVHYCNDSKTEALIKAVQESGVCWMGGSKWAGKSVMRISVSSYKTTYDDIIISAKEILKIARELDK